ncbi:hypothetical protein BN130_2190 [Cronobacter malonaticus 507]|nr:hypothetical protein BN130_2190 [Cronobacter malonaticus 507]
MYQRKLNAKPACRFRISHAAQLAVNRHRRAAHKLKLTDMPARRPGRNSGCGFLQHFAALVVSLVIQCIAVNIFTDVFSHIAGSAALFRVDGFGMKTRLAGLLAFQFVEVFLVGIPADNGTHAGGVFRQHKHQHVPVRRAVVVRLRYTNAENSDFVTVEFGADARPQAGKVALRICRACAVPLGIAVSGLCGGMEFRRGGQGVELAYIPQLVTDIFKATDTGHQLAAANRRVSNAAVVFFNQADAVAFLVFQFHAFQELTGAPLLLAPLCDTAFARVGVFLFADVAQGNLQVFAPLGGDAAQAACPPFFFHHAQRRRADIFSGYVFGSNPFPPRRFASEMAGNTGSAHV